MSNIKQKQLIPNGTKVSTIKGIFYVIDFDNDFEAYLCYQEGFDGHSGFGNYYDKYKNSKYANQLKWFEEDEITPIETQQTDFRKMKPDTLIKVKIGEHEFDCPLKELLMVCKLSGNVIGKQRPKTFCGQLSAVLDFDLSLRVMIECGTVEFENVNELFDKYFIDSEKEALLKDIEEHKAILKSQQELIKELEDKYNSL